MRFVKPIRVSCLLDLGQLNQSNSKTTYIMEIPGIEDFNRLERKIERCMVMLTLLSDQEQKTLTKREIITVKDVTAEFSFSAHIQRCARATGALQWIAGSKEVKYNRSDVEFWIQANTVR
jgi:hypothetical protein